MYSAEYNIEPMGGIGVFSYKSLHNSTAHVEDPKLYRHGTHIHRSKIRLDRGAVESKD